VSLEAEGHRYLSDFTSLAQRCREQEFGFAEFRRQDTVIDLQWPADVLEQWVYDHSGNGSFLRDYQDLDLMLVAWQVEAHQVETFMTIPTGPSDADAIEYFAENPEHWVAARDQGEHLGVGLAWETHGTWKRWPIVIDRVLLDPAQQGLQLVEGRSRVGILRGRRRRGLHVADKHMAWVGRSRT